MSDSTGCRLWDLRRLVADDTPGVIEALGMPAEHPLPRSPRVALSSDRDLLTSGRLWAERDADLRVDTQRLARGGRAGGYGPLNRTSATR